MSKKRNRHNQAGPGPANKKHKSNHHIQSSSKLATSANRPPPSKKTSTANPNQPQNQPTIPFNYTDRILLVGEGDFSFAHSLLRHHAGRFSELCATCFDGREELVRKYPQAEGYIGGLLASSGHAAVTKDRDEESIIKTADDDRYDSDAEYDSEGNVISHSDDDAKRTAQARARPVCNVLYNIDATKLHTYKSLRKRPAFTRIIFNFPHVGGKSKDINRQVRYNQALLHSFFESAKQLLSSQSQSHRPPSSLSSYDPHTNGRAKQQQRQEQQRQQQRKEKQDSPRDGQGAVTEAQSTVLVTLFEGSPYTLWNIRDLARSAGLSVVRSWKFDARVYPGYEHARTLGNVHAKGRGKVGGGGGEEEADQGDDDDGAGSSSGGEGGDEEGDENEDGGAESDEGGENEDDEFDGFSEDGDEGMKGDGDEGEDVQGVKAHTQKRPGRWRGEERLARTYEFALSKPQNVRDRNEEGANANDGFADFRENKKRKRKGGRLHDESDGDD